MVLAIGTIVFSRDKHRRTKSRHFGGFFVVSLLVLPSHY